MLQLPRHFGLTRAAALRMFVAEDVAGELHRSPAEVDPQTVAGAACAAVDDWWARFPAVVELLEGASWSRYRWTLSLHFLARHQRNDLLDLTVDYIEYVAATTLGGGRRGEQLLFSMTEQQFVHLRYRLSLRMHDIAHVLGLADAAVQEVGRSASAKLQRSIERDIEMPVLDDDPDDDPDDDANDGQPV
jgi:hypothetical protein